MKKLIPVLSLCILCISLISCNENKKEKIKIIYDTDVGNDVDDVLALAMLYNYIDAGKVDLLGITISKANEYTISFIDLMNKFYKHPDIPIGYVYEGEKKGTGRFLKKTLETKKNGINVFSMGKTLDDSIPEAYKLQRKLLASQPDQSVVFVVVGFHTNIKRLLESEPDEYSELNGVELVRKKVRLLSVMAGCFVSKNPEYNVVVDIPSSKVLFDRWPTEIIVSPVELGGPVLYPPMSILNDFGDPEIHPLCLSYMYYAEMPYYRCCFDLTSVLQAVEPNGNYFNFSAMGEVQVTDSGVTVFEPKPNGKHSYMTITNEQIPKVRLALIQRVTGKNEINPIFEKEVSIPPIDMSLFFDGIDHWMMTHKIDYPRYKPQEVIQIADNIIVFQNADGGWPRNIDLYAKIDIDSLKKTLSSGTLKSSFDNRNIYPQIEFLSKMYHYTKDDHYKLSSLKGLDYILNVQNPVSGGWRGVDVDAVTFNDDVMTGIMYLLRDIVEGKEYYSWIPEAKKSEINLAYQKSLDVTLKCQIVVSGKKTAWGQQHDHNTLKPVNARTFELAAICPMETVSILEFFMGLKDPDIRVRDAIKCAVEWLEKVQIKGIRIEQVKIEKGMFDKMLNKEYDRVVIKDPDAPPIWARFYEIDTNRPFMCNRDGKKVYSLSEVALERRVGYSWYSGVPRKMIDSDYPNWKILYGIK